MSKKKVAEWKTLAPTKNPLDANAEMMELEAFLASPEASDLSAVERAALEHMVLAPYNVATVTESCRHHALILRVLRRGDEILVPAHGEMVQIFDEAMGQAEAAGA